MLLLAPRSKRRLGCAIDMDLPTNHRERGKIVRRLGDLAEAHAERQGLESAIAWLTREVVELGARYIEPEVDESLCAGPVDPWCAYERRARLG